MRLFWDFQEGKPQDKAQLNKRKPRVSFISKDFILTCFSEETKVERPLALPEGCAKYSKILILEQPCL